MTVCLNDYDVLILYEAQMAVINQERSNTDQCVSKHHWIFAFQIIKLMLLLVFNGICQVQINTNTNTPLKCYDRENVLQNSRFWHIIVVALYLGTT